jgi:hypothetical protein
MTQNSLFTLYAMYKNHYYKFIYIYIIGYKSKNKKIRQTLISILYSIKCILYNLLVTIRIDAIFFNLSQFVFTSLSLPSYWSTWIS